MARSNNYDDNGLTNREKEVLALIWEGKDNDYIAQKLSITVGVVKLHVHHSITKLQAENRHHAAIVAYKKGLLQQ